MSNEDLVPCALCGGTLRWGSEESEQHINAVYCKSCETDFTVHWQTTPENYLKHFNNRNPLIDKERQYLWTKITDIVHGYWRTEPIPCERFEAFLREIKAEILQTKKE